MCGIIGISCQDGELTSMLMKEFLLQSQIRGKHATGIAYLDKGKVKSISEPIPSSEFIKRDFPESSLMIGHTRYSTSDIRFNQPIATQEIALVHNGVITQEAFDNWSEHFKYSNFSTENDTELLLKCVEDFDNPFLKFINASIACGILSRHELICVRNNTRPLWLFFNEHFCGFASTEDIIKRSTENLGIEVEVQKTEPFKEYHFTEVGRGVWDKKVKHNQTMLFSEDQQS